MFFAYASSRDTRTIFIYNYVQDERSNDPRVANKKRKTKKTLFKKKKKRTIKPR